MTTPPEPLQVPLIVTAEQVAVKAGLPVPLAAELVPVVEAAIREAQAVLEGWLGRGVTPRQYVDANVAPQWDGSWLLTHTPVRQVVSAVAELYPSGEATGLYTVTYVAGLDGANDLELEPLRAYVRAHAARSDEVQRAVRQVAPDSGRVAKSLSAEGQSVTFEAERPAAAAGSGEAGAPPTLESCQRWRLAGARVSQRRGRNVPWPYGEPGGWMPGLGVWW